MSKESLDYQKLCSNYYSSWEEGCCMESCEFYNHNECPVVYVKGLIADLETKLAEKDTKLHEFIRCALEDYSDNTKEIIKLKQQLAEKDKAIENWQTMYQSVMQSCHNGIEEDKRLREQLAEWERDSNATLNEYRAIKYENKQLKQQLAEKEKEIEEINKEFVQAVKDWKLLVEQKNKDIAELEEQDEIYHNQLAIEQLEKVKELLYPELRFDYSLYLRVMHELDNQIEELTHQHENKGEINESI